VSLLVGGFAMAIAGPVAVAGPVVTNRQGTVLTVANWCTGEELTFVGTWKYVIKQNRDGTSTWISTVHATTANQYSFKQTRKSVFDSSGGFESKGDDHELLVSRGDAPVAIGWLHFDFTVSPALFILRFDCRG
jgi:hypothetical protein